MNRRGCFWLVAIACLFLAYVLAITVPGLLLMK